MATRLCCSNPLSVGCFPLKQRSGNLLILTCPRCGAVELRITANGECKNGHILRQVAGLELSCLSVLCPRSGISALTRELVVETRERFRTNKGDLLSVSFAGAVLNRVEPMPGARPMPAIAPTTEKRQRPTSPQRLVKRASPRSARPAVAWWSSSSHADGSC